MEICTDDKKKIDWFQYETKKISILWHEKVQPFGYYNHLQHAIDFLCEIGLNPVDFEFNCGGEMITFVKIPTRIDEKTI